MFKVLKKLVKPLGSLKLGLSLLFLLFVLVLWGTFAQVENGIYYATKQFFTCFWVKVSITETLKIPLFPGGLLIGSLLLINLLVAHLTRLTFKIKKMGIWFIHSGLVILILGAGMTSYMAVESQLSIQEGESKNYSESRDLAELVIIDISDPSIDKVYAFEDLLLKEKSLLKHPELPITLRVDAYYRNSQLLNRGISTVKTRQGADRLLRIKPLPINKQDNAQNIKSAYITLIKPGNKEMPYLLSTALKPSQIFDYNGIQYRIELRRKRYYLPFYIRLNNFTRKLYPGTTIPKDFSSQVSIEFEDKSQIEALIYMNHPLRFAGKTFFQASFGENETLSVLQVVDNSAWLIPYLSCGFISVGLLFQCMVVFIRFLKKTRKEEKHEALI